MRTRVLFVLVSTLLLGNPDVEAQVGWKGQSFVVGNDQRFEACAPDYAGSGRPLSFVDGVSYLPEKDDDYNFAFEPTNDRCYVVTGTGGNGKSHVSFRLNTWALPDYVGWERFPILLQNKTGHDAKHFAVPPGSDAVVLIELLRYWPGGDDDLAYATRALAFDRDILITAVNDFGRNNSSSVLLRVTVLYWDSTIPVRVRTTRLTAGMTGGSYTTIDNSAFWLATPTAYMTDTSKYRYQDFDNLAGALNHPSLAGKKIDKFGVVKDVFSAGSSIATGELPGILWNLGKSAYKYLKFGLGPDHRDDDFYFRTMMTNSTVTLAIGDGNQYSLSEVSVWDISFP
jgi:hypothetical protein